MARWLAENEVPAVRTLPVEQPVEAAGRPVTFWVELSPHGIGTVRDVVTLPKMLHPLPVPDFSLDRLDPFVRVSERIDAATSLSEDDRGWLRHRHAELRELWEHGPVGLPECVVHGDAWVGNVARTTSGPLRDLRGPVRGEAPRVAGGGTIPASTAYAGVENLAPGTGKGSCSWTDWRDAPTCCSAMARCSSTLSSRLSWGGYLNASRCPHLATVRPPRSACLSGPHPRLRQLGGRHAAHRPQLSGVGDPRRV